MALKRVVYGRRGEPFRIPGHTLRYTPGTRPVRSRYRSSHNDVARYDALQTAWLCNHLQEGDVAIDVGACYGSYSVLMAALCGRTGCVVAFEPDPHSRAILGTNIKLNARLKPPLIEAFACSDQVGTTILYSQGGNSQSSLARSALGTANAQKCEEIMVPLVTLDSYVSERGLGRVRCVKIDAEGAEIRILKGAKQLLAGNADVICELHPYAWPEFGNTLADLKQIAASAGRHIRYLDQDTEIGEAASYGTVLLERQR